MDLKQFSAILFSFVMLFQLYLFLYLVPCSYYDNKDFNSSIQDFGIYNLVNSEPMKLVMAIFLSVVLNCRKVLKLGIL